MLSQSAFDEAVQTCIAKNDVSYRVRSKLPSDAIAVSWTLRGMEGGSCWGTDARYFSGDQEPELSQLLEFLESIDARLREARQILARLTTGEVTEEGYYGNYSVLGYKYIAASTLCDTLQEMGYVEPRPETPAP